MGLIFNATDSGDDVTDTGLAINACHNLAAIECKPPMRGQLILHCAVLLQEYLKQWRRKKMIANVFSEILFYNFEKWQRIKTR